MSVNLRRALVVGTTSVALGAGFGAAPASAHTLSQTRALSEAREVALQGADRFERIRVTCNRRESVHRFRCVAQYFLAEDNGRLSADSFIRIAYRSSTSRRFNRREYEFECYTSACRGDE